MELWAVDEGSQVLYQGKPWTITKWADWSNIYAVCNEDGRKQILPIADVQPVAAKRRKEPLRSISDRRWAGAAKKKEIIDPLLLKERLTREAVKEVALAAGRDIATIYRWLAEWREYNSLEALVDEKRGRAAGADGIPQEVEGFIDHYIQTVLLTTQKLSLSAMVRKLQDALRNAGLRKVGRTALIERIGRVPGLVRARKQGDKRKEEKHSNHSGTSPLGEFVLSDWQVDHTPLSLVVVDGEKRRPIRRVWLTVVIDCRSRMLVGWYLSFESPSSVSVAMALAHAMCPKEQYLARIGVKGEYPVWSKPRNLHADNAGEFRGEAMRLGCYRHDLTIQWRPVKKPHYGAHIEASIGTIEDLIAELHGALKHTPLARGSYDANAESAHTLESLEQVFAHWVVNIYAKRPHSGLNKRTPIAVWAEEFFKFSSLDGTSGSPPPRPMGYHDIVRDFLPSFRRYIHSYGVEIEGITYMSPALNMFIGEKNRWEDKEPKFLFKRDDRWISPIYFLNPCSNEYEEVPYADPSRPLMSVWDLEAAKKRLREQGIREYDEEAIFRAWAELEEMNKRAKETTDAIRKQEKRRRRDQERQQLQPSPPKPETPAPAPPSVQPAAPDAVSETPRPRRRPDFSDIEF